MGRVGCKRVGVSGGWANTLHYSPAHFRSNTLTVHTQTHRHIHTHTSTPPLSSTPLTSAVAGLPSPSPSLADDLVRTNSLSFRSLPLALGDGMRSLSVVAPQLPWPVGERGGSVKEEGLPGGRWAGEKRGVCKWGGWGESGWGWESGRGGGERVG